LAGSVLRREKSDKPERKSPESFSAFRASSIAKVAVKKRFEPVSVASQFVSNPLNTGFTLPSPARFVAIRLYDFDTFSTLELSLSPEVSRQQYPRDIIGQMAVPLFRHISPDFMSFLKLASARSSN